MCTGKFVVGWVMYAMYGMADSLGDLNLFFLRAFYKDECCGA